MAQGILLGYIVERMLKEFGASIGEDHKSEVEKTVDSRLVKALGSDWTRLPLSGKRMMVLIIILNSVLLPKGVTPATIADAAIKKGKEYDLDDKFMGLMESVQDSSHISKEKLDEFAEYAGEKGRTATGFLKDVTSDITDGVKTLFTKGKSFVSKNKSEEEEEEED